MTTPKWNGVSAEAKDFVRSLMEVNPTKRLSAQQALEHPWITNTRDALDTVETSSEPSSCGSLEDETNKALIALCEFSNASRFRRCCMRTLVWSLRNEDHAKVRDIFTFLDTNRRGALTRSDLKDAMVDRFRLVGENDLDRVFEALDM